MSKKILAAIIIFLLVSISLLVVYFELQPVPLDKVSLAIEDLGDDYKEFDKNHITTPYIASSEYLFEGKKILESYKVRFNKINENGETNDSCFITIEIAKLEKNYEEAISTIKNTTFIYDYTELYNVTIGEESYVGESITTITIDSEPRNVTLYFIVFRIGNIIVAMVTSEHTLDASINYATTMETNILNYYN
jgi:hypothetical protein